MKVVKISKGNGNTREISIKGFPFRAFFKVDYGINVMLISSSTNDGRSWHSMTVKRRSNSSSGEPRWVDQKGFDDFITMHVQDGISVELDGDNVITIKLQGEKRW